MCAIGQALDASACGVAAEVEGGEAVMFRRDTVFIVGAGASSEVGLPVGSKLATLISDLMRFEFDFGQMTKGDGEIFAAWDRHFLDNDKLNEHMRAARRLSDGIFLVKSIDDFLHIHEHDECLKFCGKTSIVRLILEAERTSKLFIDHADKSQTINIQDINNTWYVEFAKMLTVRRRKEDLGNLFDGISIVCFNYDRCIQHFLIHALMPLYSIKKEAAEAVVSSLEIYHPYGTVGELQTNLKPQGTPFGDRVDGETLLRLSNGIRTFNEQVDDAETLNALKAKIADAETLVFLGFGYHEQNMDLLQPVEKGHIQRAFGTARNISEFDCIQVRNKISNLGKRNFQTMQIDKELSCINLFQEFQINL